MRHETRVVFFIICFCLVSQIVSAEESFQYDSGGRRDPFIPLVSEDGTIVSDIYGVKGIKDIRLEGIVWDDSGGSIAIINGEIFREKQEIGSLRVLEIKKTGVVFDVNEEKVELELREE